MAENRVCRHCNVLYSNIPDNFHKAGKGNFYSVCKTCRSKKVSDDYTASFATSERKRLFDQNRRIKIRMEVLNHYGNGSPACSCCGETEDVFLTLDHILNNGNDHRKEIGQGGLHLYRWAKRNNYPDTVQILCRNCNWAKHVLGECVHKSKKGR